jgi:hypothetical protein
MENAQYLDDITQDPIRDDKWRSRDHELACSRNAAGSPHFRVIGQQCFNALNNVQRNTSRGCRIVLLDVGTQRGKIAIASGDQTGVMNAWGSVAHPGAPRTLPSP